MSAILFHSNIFESNFSRFSFFHLHKTKLPAPSCPSQTPRTLKSNPFNSPSQSNHFSLNRLSNPSTAFLPLEELSSFEVTSPRASRSCTVEQSYRYLFKSLESWTFLSALYMMSELSSEEPLWSAYFATR